MIIRMRAVGLTGVTLVSLDSYMSPVGHFVFHFRSRNVFFSHFLSPSVSASCWLALCLGAEHIKNEQTSELSSLILQFYGKVPDIRTLFFGVWQNEEVKIPLKYCTLGCINLTSALLTDSWSDTTALFSPPSLNSIYHNVCCRNVM